MWVRCGLRDILVLIKLRQTVFLTLAMYIGMFAAGLPTLEQILVGGVTAFIAIASTTAINMVFDADIDAVMERTKHRPIPQGRCSARAVLMTSLALLAIATVTGWLYLNSLYAIFIMVGAAADIILYTICTKRRTWTSIFLGSVAGASPVLGGYAAVKGVVDFIAVALSFVIVAWIPAHIWSLALHYREDYKRAGIPMLPVIVTPRLAKFGVAISILSFTAAVYLIGLLKGGLHVYLALVSSLPALAALASLRRCREASCLLTFRLVNVSLGVFLTLFILSSLSKIP